MHRQAWPGQHRGQSQLQVSLLSHCTCLFFLFYMRPCYYMGRPVPLRLVVQSWWFSSYCRPMALCRAGVWVRWGIWYREEGSPYTQYQLLYNAVQWIIKELFMLGVIMFDCLLLCTYSILLHSILVGCFFINTLSSFFPAWIRKLELKFK